MLLLLYMYLLCCLGRLHNAAVCCSARMRRVNERRRFRCWNRSRIYGMVHSDATFAGASGLTNSRTLRSKRILIFRIVFSVLVYSLKTPSLHLRYVNLQARAPHGLHQEFAGPRSPTQCPTSTTAERATRALKRAFTPCQGDVACPQCSNLAELGKLHCRRCRWQTKSRALRLRVRLTQSPTLTLAG
jgi:hypothetical protein